MTTAEKLDKVRKALAKIRQVERRNGAAIPANAGPGALVEHMFDFNANNTRTLWDDINTIDAVKGVVYNNGYWRQSRNTIKAPEPLDLTAEELMEYEINDPRLTEGLHSWAVVRITKSGTEILTYGGNYYRAYVKRIVEDYEEQEATDPDTGETTTQQVLVGTHEEITQTGNIIPLPDKLRELDSAWLGVQHWECEPVKHPIYTEGGVEYYCVPCDLPTALEQLMVCHLYAGDTHTSYSLSTGKYTADDATIQLPDGIWYIHDASKLESAPAGLMVPVDLTVDRIRIDYSPVVDPLRRLALVGDSFGEEYVISVIDDNTKFGGTWDE